MLSSVYWTLNTCEREVRRNKMVLNLLKYQEHKWIMCVDLKMVNFLLGQQSGYIKYPYFLCLWDSRAKERHWLQREWPKREMLTVGKHNVIHEQLVDKEKIGLD